MRTIEIEYTTVLLSSDVNAERTRTKIYAPMDMSPLDAVSNFMTNMGLNMSYMVSYKVLG